MKQKVAMLGIFAGFLLLGLTLAHHSLSDSMQMPATIAVTSITISVLLLAYKEMPKDERELQISILAGKRAYLVGSILLLIAMLEQAINHTFDPWVPAILACMFIAKGITHTIEK